MSWLSDWPRCRRAALFATIVWVCAALGLLLAAALAVGKVKWGYPEPRADKNWEVDDWRSDQCETLHRDSVVRERQNTWSNLAYLYAGILVLFRARRVLPVFFGVALCALAGTSGMYHASVTGFWQTADIFGVYCVLLGLNCLAGEALWRSQGGGGNPLTGYAVTCAVVTPLLSFAAAHWRGDTVVVLGISLLDSTVVFIVMVVALVALLTLSLVSEQVAANRKQKHSDLSANRFFLGCGHILDHVGMFMFYVLVTAAPAFVLRLMDGKNGDGSTKDLCSPDGMLGFLQAHATWHVLSALALLLAYDLFARVTRDDSRIFSDD